MNFRSNTASESPKKRYQAIQPALIIGLIRLKNKPGRVGQAQSWQWFKR
jgi:hypothetical protein